MAHEVVMPQLGLSMDSGEIIQWLKRSGEQIQPGDLLLEVESDKSTVEVEAVESGRLHIVRTPEDGSVPVGSVIAYLLSEGEQPPETVSVSTADPKAPVPVVMQTSPVSLSNGEGHSQPATRRPPSSPAARRRAAELGIDWRLAPATGRGARIRERDIVAFAASLSAAPAATEVFEIQISPVARRLAESTGIDLTDLARKYPGRRLDRADVETALRDAMQSGAPSGNFEGTSFGIDTYTAPAISVAAAASGQHAPLTSLRRRIAERMVKSAHTNATVTLTTQADATELVKIRETHKSDPNTTVVPSYNVLFAALVARALRDFPYMNASLDGSEFIIWDAVHIGIAVDTERGLVVPVVRDVHTKTIAALAEEMADLLKRASEGKALPDELTGGTFTITNLGTYEIDAFTPIINPPECAVLGIGRLVDRVVPFEGRVAIRRTVDLSLTFDHRLVDGGPAARFVQRIKQFVEQPYRWLS